MGSASASHERANHAHYEGPLRNISGYEKTGPDFTESRRPSALNPGKPNQAALPHTVLELVY